MYWTHFLNIGFIIVAWFFTDEVFYVFPSGCTKDIKLKNPFKVYAANTSQTRKKNLEITCIVKKISRQLCTHMYYEQIQHTILKTCFVFLYVLNPFFEQVFWILFPCLGSVFWISVLDPCFKSMFWVRVFKTGFSFNLQSKW